MLGMQVATRNNSSIDRMRRAGDKIARFVVCQQANDPRNSSPVLAVFRITSKRRRVGGLKV